MNGRAETVHNQIMDMMVMSDEDMIRRGDAIAKIKKAASGKSSLGLVLTVDAGVDALREIQAAQPSPDVAALVEALVDALEFYADRDNYEPVYERMPCDCCTEIYEPVKRDEGDTARAALAAWKGGGAA